ncbi:MAG: transcriptional regulator [Myxococcales bacterium]|nr:transcriptional regulator [Myxococcales bacterium]
MTSALVDAYRAGAPDAALAIAPAELAALGDLLAARCAEAEAGLPGVAVDRAELCRALAIRATPTTLADVDAVELALALACARGDRTALTTFERDYLRQVPAGLGHMRLDGAVVDDVVQHTRTRLLVAEPGATARIVAYAGQGKLRGLVQVVAARIALDHVRGQPRAAPDELGDLAAVADDPELTFLKATYRDAWKSAFTEAVDDLDARARNLLRLHHLTGATLEQLAAMYSVHRATVVRWLADARGRLLDGTRRRLTTALAVSPTEVDSILALIASRLEASVGRLLAEDRADE